MKNTLLALLLVSSVIQNSFMSEAQAQVRGNPRAAAKIANFIAKKKPKAPEAPKPIEKKGPVAKVQKYFEEKVDMRFVRSLTTNGLINIPILFVAYEATWPHVLKGLCALEAKTTGPKTVLIKPDACALYYGDAKFNSCQVANDRVALMFPTPRQGISVRFHGDFKDGKLQRVTQAYVAFEADKKKDFKLISLPIEMIFNQSEIAADFRPTPGTSILNSAIESEDEAEAFKFFEEVGAVMRMAYSECSDGKYEKMLQDIAKRHGVTMQTSASTPAIAQGTKK